MKLSRIIVIVIATALLASCYSGSNAPVVNGWTQPNAGRSHYRVKKGDTIYSIAWAFGLDYRALAEINNLPPPYRIRVGQRLRMTTVARSQTGNIAAVRPSKRKTTARSRRKQTKRSTIAQVRRYGPGKPVRRWRWPARGRIVQGFSSSLTGNKGINIAGRLGEPVRASAAGVVVYSGAGVRGYGNLVIIKHNNSYLSAYAFNRRLLVRVGNHVKAGQVIAEMGRNNTGTVELHFEIRRNGRPVNPMRYL